MELDELFMMDFLSPDAKDDVELPSGERFAPTGFIAPWSAGYYYRLYDESDLVQMEIPFDFRNKTTNGYFYFFAETEAAQVAQEALAQQYTPSQFWTFKTPTDDILNFTNEEAKSKFGSEISYVVRVKTLGSTKYRHEFQLLAMPAAVSAYARAIGLDVPEFDITPLAELDTDMTDKQQADLIGHPDLEVSWEKSFYGKQRIAIWNALSEENAKAYLPVGETLPSGNPSPYACTSQQLANCLLIIRRKWSKPAWARVVPVPDPRVDAVYGEGKRLTIPLVTEFYPDKAAAVAAAGDQETAGPTGGKPAYPMDWVNDPIAWESYVGNVVTLVTREEEPKPKLLAIAEIFGGNWRDKEKSNAGATEDEILIWVDYLLEK